MAVENMNTYICYKVVFLKADVFYQLSSSQLLLVSFKRYMLVRHLSALAVIASNFLLQIAGIFKKIDRVPKNFL